MVSVHQWTGPALSCFTLLLRLGCVLLVSTPFRTCVTDSDVQGDHTDAACIESKAICNISHWRRFHQPHLRALAHNQVRRRYLTSRKCCRSCSFGCLIDQCDHIAYAQRQRRYSCTHNCYNRSMPIQVRKFEILCMDVLL